MYPQKLLIVVIIVVLSAASSVLGQDTQQEPTNLQQLDQQLIDQQLIDQFHGRTNLATEGRYYDCMKTFGHEGFCSCLRDRAPAISTFDLYVQVVTSTKEELEYDSLDLDWQELVDGAIATREECVASSF